MKAGDNLNALMRSFWEIEVVIESSKIENKEELECEDHFIKTHH